MNPKRNMIKTGILHRVSVAGIYCQLPFRATCIKGSVETDKMHLLRATGR